VVGNFAACARATGKEADTRRRRGSWSGRGADVEMTCEIRGVCVFAGQRCDR
jgi:hypothetical protein